MQPVDVVKSSREVVRIQRSIYKGRDLLDVRVFVPTTDGTLVATPRGVALPVEIAGDVGRAVLAMLCEETANPVPVPAEGA